jgi:uncharacterized protein YjdB
MNKKLGTLLMVCALLCSMIVSTPTMSVKAAENKDSKVYYAETDEDEIIAFQRALAKHEENFTIRYLASKEGDFSYFGTDAIDASEFDRPYWRDKLSVNSSYGLTNWENTEYTESYITAKGQKWLNIDYKYNYLDSYEEYKELNKEIRKLIIDSGVAIKSDYEKTKWAYDWICNNISYDYTGSTITAYETFKNKKAICEGYSRLFELFAGELGLNTRYLRGLADNGSWGAHAWNMVEFDGKWYQLDTTWGATHGSKYFLKGSTAFDIDHSISYTASDSQLNSKISTTDFISSNQNSGVPARLYNINLDPVYIERLNINEEYDWLVSNNTDIKLQFSNSNPEVVSLSADGKVKALKTGKATLTAVNKELGIKQSIDITVSKEKATEGISEFTTIKSANNISIVYGKTAQIKLTLKDTKGKLQNVKYTSKDKSIATVDKNGKVTGVKAGSTTISITCDNGSKITIKVTVKPLVKTKTATVKVNNKVSLRDAIVISKNGYKDLKFAVETKSTISINGTTSNSKSIITVTSDGYVTGKKKGTATVEIYNKSTNKLLGTVKVTVK